MTSSQIRRITTEEEAKAALAERRRLAREQAEREAELEQQRLVCDNFFRCHYIRVYISSIKIFTIIGSRKISRRRTFEKRRRRTTKNGRRTTSVIRRIQKSRRRTIIIGYSSR